MSGSGCCDGCGLLSFEKPVNRYDCFRALCCDPDKPVMGARRVVATSGVRRPRFIERPVWCRGKELGDEEDPGIDQ